MTLGLRRAKALSAVCAALLLVACNAPSPIDESSGSVEEETVSVVAISSIDAYHMTVTREVTLIDVRGGDERTAAGAPASARPVEYERRWWQWDRSEGNEAFLDRVLASVNEDKTRPIALISNRGVVSRRAGALLAARGFTNVYYVVDGYQGTEDGPGWIGWGLPVTNGTQPEAAP